MTDPDPYALARFVDAQASTYAQALAELHRGRKTGHWMWFVFPQVAGLGQSPTSRFYAISGLGEARAYLDHPVLGPRLRECAQVVAATTGRSAVDVFGGIDAQKLRSSMTLFGLADPAEPNFGAVLDAFFDGESDALTKRVLSKC